MTLLPLLVLSLMSAKPVSADVTLVVPTKAAHPGDGEIRAALTTTGLVRGMLGELGLRADTIEEPALARGVLAGRRVAVLAYNPRLADEAAEALARFVEDGGKLLVCYTLPPRLGAALGFGKAKYVPRERPGGLAEIRFDAADVAGLPTRVQQASWNITVAEPVGHGARVIGRWYDDAGKPTGHAAMLLSDRGAFFSHIILGDDREGKKQMLAAVLGHLERPLWQSMARAATQAIGRVGHCEDEASLAAFLQPCGDPQVINLRKLALAAKGRAVELAAADDYPRALDESRKAQAMLREAYLRAQPSPPREGRAMWNHSGTGAYDGDWDRSAKLLADNGLNMILPNMLWGGLAHYASDILPRSATFQKYGDQIEQCCAAAKRHGLEVHVWKVNYNLSNAPKDFVEKLRGQGRLQATVEGKPQDWLCPSHPENQKLELDSMLEVARKYPVDGLHFDYIRYPHRECCYCDGCRTRFEAESGRKVADWPKDCYAGVRKEEYHAWRCRQITALVAAVYEQGKKLRRPHPDPLPKGEGDLPHPDPLPKREGARTLKISAAVFGGYPWCRESVGQDWPEWVKAGYLDFLCPMDYTNSDEQFVGLVENQVRLVGGKIPVYAGIGATASNATLSADRVAGQIFHARRLGAAGFTIFNLSRETAESIVPGLGLGVGARKATPPPRNP